MSEWLMEPASPRVGASAETSAARVVVGPSVTEVVGAPVEAWVDDVV